MVLPDAEGEWITLVTVDLHPGGMVTLDGEPYRVTGAWQKTEFFVSAGDERPVAGLVRRPDLACRAPRGWL